MVLTDKIKRSNKIPIALIILSIILKYTLIDYGSPNLFHPDEPYIYKDSFRILYAFSQKDFSIILNPYNLALSFWYGISFPVGKLMGLWADFTEFKNQIIAENFNIIFIGRLFSLLVSTLASIILFNYFSRNKNLFNKTLIVLIIFFNPIEWISGMWIKFDAFCYLVNVIVLINLIRYKKNEISLRSISLLLGFAFATRMDFVSYAIGFLALSFFVLPKLSIKKTVLFCFFFSISYLVLTNTFFNILLTKIISQNSVIETEEGFISVFIGKLSKYNLTDIFTNIKSNFFYYLALHIIINIPLIIYDGIFLKFKTVIQKEFIFTQLTIWFFLLVFSYNAPHYWLITQITYIVFILEKYKEIELNKKNLAISFVFVSLGISLCIQLFYFINFEKDTRLVASEYVFNNTNRNDLVAIEGYQNIGMVPSISECSNNLLEKAKFIQEKKIGTGLTYEAKAKNSANLDCRKIIEIDSENRFGTDSVAMSFVNNYNFKDLYVRKTKILISYFDCKSQENTIKNVFFTNVCKYSLSEKKVSKEFIDPRMNLFKKENFFPEFFIYSFEINH